MASQSTYMSPVWAPNLFNGKVVFCTGGAGTICSVQVGALIKLGCNAVITGRRKDKTESKAVELASLRPGAKVIGIAADVRDAKAMVAAVGRTVSELKRLDFLICGAAGNFLATVDNLSANAFKTVIDIDVLGSFNTVKAGIEELKKTKGKIIFVSATLHYTGTPFQAHVAAAKAAIDALSRSLAVEYGPRGITSNCIAPGPIAGTEGMERLTMDGDFNKVGRAVPIQRLGYPHEIADATVFIFSKAGDFITGETLVVDGGNWHRQGVFGGEYPETVLGGPLEGIPGAKKQSKL